jgi:hypothetical protein
MPRHAAKPVRQRKTKTRRRYAKSPLVFWLQRLFYVEHKRRALVLATAGVAIISTTVAAFVVTSPYAAQNMLWVNPGTMTVTAYYEKAGDPYPAGYIVTDKQTHNICTMINGDEEYTCRTVDSRR